MKKLLLAGFLIVFCTTLFSQDLEYRTEFFSSGFFQEGKKLKAYEMEKILQDDIEAKYLYKQGQKSHNIGKACMIGGGGLMIAGILIEDSETALYMLGGAIALDIFALVFILDGNGKYKETAYQYNLNLREKSSFRIGSQRHGIGIAFNF